MEQFYFNYSSKPEYLKTPGELNDVSIIDESLAPKLFQKLKIKNLEIKNKIVVSPMCTYSSNNDGLVNDWHFSHYTGLIKGGAGLVMVEASAVTPDGRITYGDLGIWSDEHVKNLKRIVDFANEFGSKMAIQIAHSGRKGSTHPIFLDGSRNSISENDPLGRGWTVKGASPIAWSDTMSTPIEMTKQDIIDVVDSFKQAARRSREAGFSLIEIHSAHGYLISSFLSPTSNKRTDEYTGSTFEGRIKLLLDIIKAVREEWSTDKPLAVRISCEEYVGEQGWTINDTIRLAKILDQLDVDILDCSSGGNNSNQVIKAGPLYQVPFSQKVKENTSKLLVGAVGLITNAKDAESILQENKADLIFIGRSFLKNPFLTFEFASQLNVVVSYPPQYELANRRHRIQM